jgi:hypothetical protein
MAKVRQSLGFIGGYIPWIVFWVVASPQTWEWAVLAAFVSAVVIAIPERREVGLKLMDYANILVFGIFTLCAIFLDRADLDWLEEYSMTLSTFLLAAIVLGSLAVDPFTAQYARDDVPKEYWDTPNFVHINRVLTAVWGLAFVLMGILSLIGERSDSSDTNAIFQWVIPIAILLLAFKFTKAYPDRYTAEHAQPQAPAAAPPPAS